MIRGLSSIISLLVLTSCASSQLPFSRVSYNVIFEMVTCGNILNPNIYSPDVGPEGFVSFRSFFLKGFELRLERNFSYVFVYQLKHKEPVEYCGTYFSQAANMGSVFLDVPDKEFVLTWLNDYQIVFECDIVSLDTDEPLHAVALLRSIDTVTM